VSEVRVQASPRPILHVRILTSARVKACSGRCCLTRGRLMQIAINKYQLSKALAPSQDSKPTTAVCSLQYFSVNHKSNLWALSPYQSSNTAATGSTPSGSQSVKCQPFQRVRPLKVQSSWLCTLAPSWTRSCLNHGTITDGVETESASCSFLFVYPRTPPYP
jgi:hypothetical protein